MLNKGLNYTRRQFSSEVLKKTHLYKYQCDKLNAKMVHFAGYDMPVLYPEEHLHCRASE